jgi:hypothetical protein
MTEPRQAMDDSRRPHSVSLALLEFVLIAATARRVDFR